MLKVLDRFDNGFIIIMSLVRRVKVMETRPLSKDKRWRVVEIIEKAK